MLKPNKPLTIKKEKQKAWKAFSLYIRMKHSENSNPAEMNRNDMVECYTCGKHLAIKEAQCGHAIGGRNNSILFNEDLVRPQCVGCNIFGRGQYARFTRKLIDELGLEKYDELVALAGQTKQYKAIDYKEIAEKYKAKLAQLT